MGQIAKIATPDHCPSLKEKDCLRNVTNVTNFTSPWGPWRHVTRSAVVRPKSQPFDAASHLNWATHECQETIQHPYPAQMSTWRNRSRACNQLVGGSEGSADKVYSITISYDGNLILEVWSIAPQPSRCQDVPSEPQLCLGKSYMSQRFIKKSADVKYGVRMFSHNVHMFSCGLDWNSSCHWRAPSKTSERRAQHSQRPPNLALPLGSWVQTCQTCLHSASLCIMFEPWAWAAMRF